MTARRLLICAAACVLAGPGATVPRAQSNQPIYPAYDGYLRNPDGSLTLSFAYFSHNAQPVTIPPGDQNSFQPAPGDRQQPTVFKPGHHRFQCIMVVGPEFDGKLRWTLSHAGTATGTSERMLQSNWNLVEGAAELKQIDYAKVPKGVCLNRAPSVRVLGARVVPGGRGQAPTNHLTASVGEEFSLFGSVNDEGLPRGVALRAGWTQLSGPARVVFDRRSMARTHARFSAPGVYELELRASDSELEAATKVMVTVK